MQEYFLEKKCMPQKLFVKNFYANRCSYYLVVPFMRDGMRNSQSIMFGPQFGDVFINEHFWTSKGVDITGAYFPYKALRRMIRETIDIIVKRPARVNAIHRKTYEVNKEYRAYAKSLLKINLQKLTNKELGKILKKLLDIQRKSHQHAVITTWFVDSDGEDLSQMLIEKTKDFVKKSGSDVNFADAFSLLTTLPRESFGMKEEKESWKVLQKIQEDVNAKKIFLSLKNFSHIPEGINPEVKRVIEGHYKKWNWSPFTYLGPAYTVDHYLKMWSDLLKQGADVDRELQALKQWIPRIKKERVRIIKKLKIDKKDQQIFDIAADIVFLKGYRKDCMFFGFYVLDRILREISRRLYVSLNQLHTMAYWEVIDILNGNAEVDTTELNARAKFSVIHYKNGVLRILTGEKAKTFYEKQNIKQEVVNPDTKELRGTCACSGQANGKVTIVNIPEEISKMKKGDVMVAHTTFPSLVPAMKLASAIVTEDGGITCHAAIVARELGTPCITGIKTALQVLKDGMKVEINADEGIVKIVEEK